MHTSAQVFLALITHYISICRLGISYSRRKVSRQCTPVVVSRLVEDNSEAHQETEGSSGSDESAHGLPITLVKTFSFNRGVGVAVAVKRFNRDLTDCQVALLKFIGYKIINNVSDTGKAFLIILITDIFLGYHSESGWQTLLEIIVDHYGFDVDQSGIVIFVCLIPVIIDACVKLWTKWK